ncbi:transducin beta-like protein 2 isoform X3 [Herpailurus yagouaroundi]|uniref:Transducin beta-like protein 2 isoform X2 n=1 Tax=Acinonyx jubatus TaxID=32536 RepID=A0A6J1XYX5_ACIJB|nr:transducin beta-like protein 2 isoform X2 [Acinonyx jubatus]XP_040312059.1 transducin beta-like protein 2 isoform X3 [Puma yagouaroundi]
MELPQLPELMGLSLLLGLLALMATAAVARGWWLRAEEETSSRSAGQKANGLPLDKSLRSKKQKQHQRVRKEKPQQHNFTHRLLAAALKSHSGNISCMDFSSNGKYLATCADDRTVRIWSTKDFLQREHRSMRANVELDHATLVRFSPDCRAFIVWLANGDTLRVFKMTKREDGGYTFTATPEDFPKKHKAPVVNIGIADTGKFIMTASSDTTILIWNLKGHVLSTINTNQMNNTHAAISPCSRFVASCGFTPDVKVWEVCFGKKGDFQEVVRAFELKGHSAAVHFFAFSNDSRRYLWPDDWLSSLPFKFFQVSQRAAAGGVPVWEPLPPRSFPPSRPRVEPTGRKPCGELSTPAFSNKPRELFLLLLLAAVMATWALSFSLRRLKLLTGWSHMLAE